MLPASYQVVCNLNLGLDQLCFRTLKWDNENSVHFPFTCSGVECRVWDTCFPRSVKVLGYLLLVTILNDTSCLPLKEAGVGSNLKENQHLILTWLTVLIPLVPGLHFSAHTDLHICTPFVLYWIYVQAEAHYVWHISRFWCPKDSILNLFLKEDETWVEFCVCCWGEREGFWKEACIK